MSEQLRVTWRADRSGIAHALPLPERRGAPALCGQGSIDPRWSWPSRAHCPGCEAELARRTGAAPGLGL